MLFIPPALPGPKPPGPPLVATPELGIPPIPSPDPGPPPVVSPTPRPGTPSPSPELGPAPPPSPPAPRAPPAPPGRPALFGQKKTTNQTVGAALIIFFLLIQITWRYTFTVKTIKTWYICTVNIYFLFFRNDLLPYLRALAPA